MAYRNQRQSILPLLLPVSFIYGAITKIRNWFFDIGLLQSFEFDFPVISVGNITVGGTGKTPHVEYLIKLLQEMYQLAFLSRGYKRKTKGFVLAGKKSTPDEIGDEPYQVWKNFNNIKVAVDEKRVHGIKTLKEMIPELQCIILDDAFQHRYVKPGVSILLIDYYRPLNKDRMLPAGDLRENPHGIRRADIVIVTKVPHEIKPIELRLWIKELNLSPEQFLYFTSFQYSDLQPVFHPKQRKITLLELEEIKPAILLVTGIANSTPLYERLITCCSFIEHIGFPDHYEYTDNDMGEIASRFAGLKGNEKMIITTEKDAVKLRNQTRFASVIKEKMYYLPVEVTFLAKKKEEFDRNIMNYVAKNKRISRLYS